MQPAIRCGGGGGDKPHVLASEVAPTLSARTKGGGGLGTDFDCDGGVVAEKGDSHEDGDPLPFDTTQVTSKANRSTPKPGDPCHPLAAGAHPPAVALEEGEEDTVGKRFPYQEVSHCLNAGGLGRIDYETESFIIEQEQPEPSADGLCVQTGQAIAPTLTAADTQAAKKDGKRQDGSRQGRIPAVCVTGEVTHSLNTANNGKGSSEDGTGRGVPTICVHASQDPCVEEELAQALGRNHGQENGVLTHMAVRRLIPVECERLQGFPDGHTAIARGKKSADECPDGPRYKALGNSMAVPVIRWIGERVEWALAEAIESQDEVAS